MTEREIETIVGRLYLMVAHLQAENEALKAPKPPAVSPLALVEKEKA